MQITPELANKTIKVVEEIHENARINQQNCLGKPFKDYIFTALYTKIAELELRLEELENKPQTIL